MFPLKVQSINTRNPEKYDVTTADWSTCAEFLIILPASIIIKDLSLRCIVLCNHNTDPLQGQLEAGQLEIDNQLVKHLKSAGCFEYLSSKLRD